MKDHVKDLGTWMSSSGNFDFHITKVISKVRQRIGWIRRSFMTNSISFKRFMWKNYIGGILDYNSQLWSPVNTSKISSLEQLLRSYTVNTYGLEKLNYWERLKEIGLSSIQRRFQRYKIIYIWKVIAGLTHNFGLTWNDHPHWGLLINIEKPVFYETKAAVYSIWRQSLAVEGTLLFNSMPSNVRNYPGKTLSGFKMMLDQVLENIPDCPPSHGLYPEPINTETGSNSNCLIDWSCFLKLRSRLTEENVLSSN